jgi:hypothetical protein
MGLSYAGGQNNQTIRFLSNVSGEGSVSLEETSFSRCFFVSLSFVVVIYSRQNEALYHGTSWRTTIGITQSKVRRLTETTLVYVWRLKCRKVWSL